MHIFNMCILLLFNSPAKGQQLAADVAIFQDRNTICLISPMRQLIKKKKCIKSTPLFDCDGLSGKGILKWVGVSRLFPGVVFNRSKGVGVTDIFQLISRCWTFLDFSSRRDSDLSPR